MSESRRDIYTLNGIIHNKGPPKSIFNWNHIVTNGGIYIDIPSLLRTRCFR